MKGLLTASLLISLFFPNRNLHGNTVFYDEEPEEVINGWSRDGQKYYKGGEYVTGPLLIDGDWYYFDDETGAMVHGWKYLEDEDKTVLYGEASGHLLYGEQMVGDHYFYLDDKTGAVTTGWKELKAPDRTVYYDTNGYKVFGLQIIDGKWQEFDRNTGTYIGEAEGWQYNEDLGRLVFLTGDGKPLKGKVAVNGVIYSFDEETGGLYYKGARTNLYDAETNAIIDAHRYDFNYANMNPVLANYGGYDNYIKTLGGVFTKYAPGTDIKVTTVGEFQEVAKYVWGLLTIYGVDYYKASYGGGSCWGGKYPADDAFYTDAVSLKSVYGKYNPDNIQIDDLLAGKTSAGMQVNCTQGITYILKKANLIPVSAPTVESEFYGYKQGDNGSHYYRSRGAKIIHDAGSLRVGDVIAYFSGSSYKHVAMVVSVNRSAGTYTLYDSGHCLTNKRTGLRTLRIGKSPDSMFKSYNSWAALRLPLNLR